MLRGMCGSFALTVNGDFGLFIQSRVHNNYVLLVQSLTFLLIAFGDRCNNY